MATASFDGKDNMFTRLSEMPQDDIKAAKESNKLYDKANLILESVEALGKVIKTADYQISSVIDEAKRNGENVDDIELEECGISQRYIVANILALQMEMTSVGKDSETSLYDLVTKENLTHSDIYPLLLALGEDQYASITIGGILTFLLAECITESDVDSELDKEVDEMIKTTRMDADLENTKVSGVKKENTAISIFSGVDRRYFEGSVGVTGDGQFGMAMNESDRSILFGNPTGLKTGLIFGGLAVSIAGTALAFSFFGKTASTLKNSENFLSQKVTNASRNCYVKSLTDAKALAAKYKGGLPEIRAANFVNAGYANGELVSAEIKAYPFVTDIMEADKAISSAKAAYVSARIGAAIGIAMSVTMLVFGIISAIDLANYDHPTYKDVPMMMDRKYDEKMGEYNYVRYDCVKTTDGKAGDVNAFEESEWIALYYTKDKNSGGSPLKAKYLSEPRAGYTPVHTFGFADACNMNQFTFAAKPPVVNLFFEKGDRNLILATTFSNGAKHALILTTGLLAGFGFAFGASLLVRNKKGKNKEDNLIG